MAYPRYSAVNGGSTFMSHTRRVLGREDIIRPAFWMELVGLVGFLAAVSFLRF
jgi:hypothetical protein